MSREQSICQSEPQFEFTQEQGHPKSTLLCLVSEILELIIAYVSLRDLKNLRSTCKHFSGFTDPILFHTIVLVPCRPSFNVITALPHPVRISWHVKRLVYDDRWPDVVCRIRINLQISPFFNPVRKARLIQTLEHLTQFTRSFKDDPSYEVALFKQVLDLLPSLRAVSVFSNYEHRKSPKLPGFYSRVCSNVLSKLNEASLPTIGHHESNSARSALLAIGQSGKNITNIDMDGLSWRCMFPSPSRSGILPADVLATARVLELSFGPQQYDLFFRGETLLAELGQALSQAIHLEILRLDFGEIIDCDDLDYHLDYLDDDDYWSRCMLSALFPSEHHYPDLKELDLQNFSFSEPGFLAFLDHHASTIKSLRLNSVDLVAPCQSRSPCWRRIFIHIQSALDLHQVKLHDISGGGLWIIMRPKPEKRFPGCLLDQMEEFILHGGECPIRAGCHHLNSYDLYCFGDKPWAFDEF